MKKEKYHFLIIKENSLFLFKSNYQIIKNKIQILYFQKKKKKNQSKKQIQAQLFLHLFIFTSLDGTFKSHPTF